MYCFPSCSVAPGFEGGFMCRTQDPHTKVPQKHGITLFIQQMLQKFRIAGLFPRPYSWIWKSGSALPLSSSC